MKTQFDEAECHVRKNVQRARLFLLLFLLFSSQPLSRRSLVGHRIKFKNGNGSSRDSD